MARDPDSTPKHLRSPLALEDTSSRAAFISLLRLRNVRLLMIVAMGYFLVSSGLISWVPSLLEEKGMTLTQAGWWTAAATAFSTIGILVIPGLVKRGYRAYAAIALDQAWYNQDANGAECSRSSRPPGIWIAPWPRKTPLLVQFSLPCFDSGMFGCS